MDILNITLAILIGIGIGGAFTLLFIRYLATLEKKRAQIEAKEIIEKAKDTAEFIEMDQKERLIEIEEELWTKNEPEQLKIEDRLEELEDLIKERQSHSDTSINELKKKAEPKINYLKNREDAHHKAQSKLKDLKNQSHQESEKVISTLSQKLKSSKEVFKKELIAQLVNEFELSAQKNSSHFIAEVTSTAEQRAKRILAIVIDRFARPFCAERGLGHVEIPDDHTKKNLLDKNGMVLKQVQEIGGCDLILDETETSIAIAGFDPVRRELTRRILEKLIKEKKYLNPDLIRRKGEDAKRELIKQIKYDGDMLAKELGLQNLNPEIRRMMGSLRYRYSFTQNQYFHCGEVGWLCGLLASELELPIKIARRAGMLHDIGKSMDHALDGGHAVIGADFIKERGESAEIVHAVRAHHFDEAPSTDLAFLVIAADAISGARPGARRSTIESYTQKVTELEGIARSFDGVNDCYVLSGGREVRVITDGKAINDTKALELSKNIAQRIENEVSYPGQIKVVVVRSTQVNETTRAY
jgi:ribonuclease Y